MLPRRRLRRTLDAAAARTVILVEAPAGFGKTTAVAEWAHRHDQSNRFAWLSTAPTDDDPQRFWPLFVAAVRAVEPDAFVDLRSDIEQGRDLGGNAIAANLSNALFAIDGPLTVVIDDFENISDPRTLKALTFLVATLPPMVRLMLCTRRTPDLPLSTWRASGMLSEIGAEDLRFTQREAGAYLDPIIAGALTAEQETVILNKTQGWIAGLYLAALGVRRASDTAAFVDGFDGSDGMIAEFVVDEVTGRLPETLRSFLLKTSILNTMSPSVCKAVTGRGDSAAILAALVKHGMFVAAGADGQTWVYHPLFQDALRAQLEATIDAGELRGLHLRAAEAYEVDGQFTNALRHAVASQDWATAWSIVRTHGTTMLQDHPHGLAAMLAELPDSEVEKSAACRAMQISTAAVVADLDRLEALAGRESLNKPDSLGILALGLLNYLRGEHFDLDRFWRYGARTIGPGACAAIKGLDGTVSAEYEKAASDLSTAVDRDYDEPFTPITITAILAWNRVRAGELSLGAAYAARALASAEAAGVRWFHGVRWAELARAQASFDRGQLDDALQHVERILEAGAVDERCRVETHVLAARTSAAQGKRRAATEYLAAIAGSASGATVRILSRKAALTNAQLCLLEGDIEMAAAWIPDWQSRVTQHSAQSEERLILARLLIETHRFDEAHALIEAILGADESCARTLVEAQKLHAIAALRAGDPSAPLLLEVALATGRTEGFVQTFVDDSLAMAEIGRRGNANGKADSDEAPVAGNGERPAMHSNQSQALSEPLTDRELSVLRLLPTRLTNHEIADELFISVNTIKTHVKAIYRKLEVGNRNAAVDSAVSMHLV
jgi:LuxR family maltose regulon positive regulatory protein